MCVLEREKRERERVWKKEKGGGGTLTGNGSQNIRDEDLNKGLVHEMVTGAHPLQHSLVSAEHQELRARQPTFDLTDATEK